jgi:adhesin/invasin
MSSNAHAIIRRSAAALTLALLATGCSIDKAASPAVSAPSGFGLSVSAVASPDTLPRDGQSTSTVRLTVRDPQDKPVVGQRLTVSATTGSLSAADVTTDASGIATVRFTAPAVMTSVSSATVSATPVGADLGTVISGTKTVTIALAGPKVPTASFNFDSPVAAKQSPATRSTSCPAQMGSGSP